MSVSSFCVAVALSGGADSLYSLLSLHAAGVPVMGVHGFFAQRLSFSCSGSVTEPSAPGVADEVAAELRRICEDRHIPFHAVDCTEAFCDRVVHPFVVSYAGGGTPNPCALCNAGIKFGLFQEKVRALGATHMATGHYTRLLPSSIDTLPLFARPDARDAVLATLAHEDSLGFTDGEAPPARFFSRAALGHPLLLQGADPQKEQSYFLSLVPAEALQAVVFPLGLSHKRDVLASLRYQAITPPQQKESQEVCFVPQDQYRTFLPEAAAAFQVPLGGPGPMLLPDGTRVGTHNGLWQYTQGQRKGLGIGWKEPLYVLGKDVPGNVLQLGPQSAMHSGGCRCTQVNVFVPQEFWPEEVYMKTRYREHPKKGRARLCSTAEGMTLDMFFSLPESSVAPGQVGAVYAPVHGVCETDGRPVLCLLAAGIISG